jgi:hypothetical protein
MGESLSKDVKVAAAARGVRVVEANPHTGRSECIKTKNIIKPVPRVSLVQHFLAIS